MREHLKKYIEFSKTSNVRGLRILLEYFYAMEIFKPIFNSQRRIVSIFGSARTKPNKKEYHEARELGQLLFENGYAVVTGGSSGIMQAANEGVASGIMDLMKRENPKLSEKNIRRSKSYKDYLKRYSVGLKITLPFEPQHNPFVGVHATFNYFMVRKFFFGTLSSAFIACEGGWGTRDELFEMLTLVQTGKSPLMPIIYISKDPKHLIDDINHTIRKGYISSKDRSLIDIVDNTKAALHIINQFYSVVKKINYDKIHTIDMELAKPLVESEKKELKKIIKTEYGKIFKGVSFSMGRMILTGFNYQSFGYLRKLIDLMATF